MSRTVRLVHDYAAPPAAVWAIAKDFTKLADMSAGSVSYRGLPEAPVKEGDVVDFEVKPFYARSFKPYRVEMLGVDDAARRFVSLEHGAGVKTWRHTLSVEETPGGSRQTDEIVIDAGAMTWFGALLARRMYAKRDSVRRRLLGLE